MFSKKKITKDGVSSSYTESHFSSSTSVQHLTVGSVTRSRSYSSNWGVAPSGSQTSLQSLPGLSTTNNLLNLSPSDVKSTFYNAKKVGVDAKPVVPSSINLNYQSPYRNSPVYHSFNTKKTVPVTSTIKLEPPKKVSISPTVPIIKVQEPPKKLVVKKTGILYDNDNRLPTYKTSSKNRGEVLIINNIMFDGEQERIGAKEDDKKLEDLFKQIGFKVSVKRDLKRKDMESQIESFSKKSSLKSADISVVIVMSHGTKNETLGGTEVFGIDEKGILIEDLLQYFSGDKCKNMQDKPKIFIFQCCRGSNEQFTRSDSRNVNKSPRPFADMLIAYSTLPGFVSHRDLVRGTWYIQTLCEVFSQHAHEYHVEELLKIVDVELSQFGTSSRQTSSYESRGFKRCYLHPRK